MRRRREVEPNRCPVHNEKLFRGRCFECDNRVDPPEPPNDWQTSMSAEPVRTTEEWHADAARSLRSRTELGEDGRRRPATPEEKRAAWEAHNARHPDGLLPASVLEAAITTFDRLALVPTSEPTLYRYLRNETYHCRIVDPPPIMLVKIEPSPPDPFGFFEPRARILALAELNAGVPERELHRCICGNRPTCRGAYEGQDVIGYGCDDCCGHGNEDGWCEPVGTGAA